MKTFFYILILFLATPFTGLTQNDSINKNINKEQVAFKNQIDLDVEFLGASFGYKHRLYNNWFVGGRIGGGIIFVPIYFKDGLDLGVEFFHSQFILQYSITDNIFIDVGTRLSVFYAENPVFLITPKVGVYFTVKKIQLGIRLGGPDNFSNRVAGGYLYSGDIGYSISLLIVKIPLKKW